ncbi:Kiwa anti-phage protein KwaB-like domain-containing protein [Weissella confusa]|uniref:Kiwa anti-phage protein KwaB-like domain-containing protein n=1 Tax=Weissella confusa TaxID=1583 RepID=UPI0034545766
MSSVSSIFNEAEDLLKHKGYVGAVSVYLMRYRNKTEKDGKLVKFASFYDAKIDTEIQKKLLENFVAEKEKYDGNDYEYLVNSAPSGGVGSTNVSAFSNVNNIYDSLEKGKNVVNDLSKMNVNSLKAYVVKLQLPKNKIVYYWGKIKNYSNLQRKSLIIRKEYSSSKLKNFDIQDTFGFSFEISAIISDNKIYIGDINAFESIFSMSDYYKKEAITVIKDVVKSKVVLNSVTDSIGKIALTDARVAKKVMKIKFRKEVVRAVYDNLNIDIYNEIVNDPNIKDKYAEITYINGVLGVKDENDTAQINRFLDFIGDTAKRGIASKMTSSEAL